MTNAAPANLFADQLAQLDTANHAPGAAMVIVGVITDHPQLRNLLDAHGRTRWCVRVQIAVDGPGGHHVTADIPCPDHDAAEACARQLPIGSRQRLAHAPNNLHLHMPRAALAGATA